MRNTKITLGLVTTFILLIAGFYSDHSQTVNKQITKQTQIQNIHHNLNTIKTTPTSQNNKNESLTAEKALSFGTVNINETIPSTTAVVKETRTAWDYVETSVQQPQIKLHDEISNAEQITFNRDAFIDASVGEKVTLKISESLDVSAIIEKKIVYPNGDISWNGHLENQGTDFPVTFTVGKRVSIASISTPEGRFSVEAYDDSGWLFENPDMNTLIDPDKVDVLIPGIDDAETPKG